ncbi:MAG: hypothetical protein R3E64_03020 [Halioglobus sp.]
MPKRTSFQHRWVYAKSAGGKFRVEAVIGISTPLHFPLIFRIVDNYFVHLFA